MSHRLLRSWCLPGRPSGAATDETAGNPTERARIWVPAGRQVKVASKTAHRVARQDHGHRPADLITCAHAADGRIDRMTRFLARRLLNYVVLLALASFLIFSLASWQFDPLENLQSRNPRPPAGVIDAKTSNSISTSRSRSSTALWASGVDTRRLRHHHRRATGDRRAVAAHRGQPATAGSRLGRSAPSSVWSSAHGGRSGSTG